MSFMYMAENIFVMYYNKQVEHVLKINHIRDHPYFFYVLLASYSIGRYLKMIQTFGVIPDTLCLVV